MLSSEASFSRVFWADDSGQLHALHRGTTEFSQLVNAVELHLTSFNKHREYDASRCAKGELELYTRLDIYTDQP